MGVVFFVVNKRIFEVGKYERITILILLYKIILTYKYIVLSLKYENWKLY